MQWQFRKSIESFEAYKRTSSIKNQIQNGNQSTLNTVARQIEIILNDKTQKIITKVLALRFIRDIMILGQEDIVKRTEKLIPILVKICSYQLNSSDPDRGETFFHDHPSYLKMTDQDQRKQIDTLGSTFLILSLESIFHWSKWIPYDNNGQESIYSKAYQSLIDRGVKFPSSFHYYKQSDTQKFKNMYKMQFFTDSYESAYTQSKINQSQSSIDNHSKSQRSRGKQQLKYSQGIVQQYTGNARHLKNVNELLVFLNEMRVNKTRKMGDLKEIHKKVQQMYEAKNNYQKQERKWLQSYIINFSMLNSNFISYDQFIQRCISQQIQLDQPQQQEISIYNPKQKITTRTAFKVNQANKSQLKGSILDKNEDLLKKQEFQYKTKLNSVFLQLQQKHNEIMVLKSNFEKQKNRIIDDYQSRLISIKQEIKKSQQDKGSFQKQLQKQNEKLKTKLATIQQEMTLVNYNTSRQRDLQSERNQLLTKVKKLQIENQKLSQAKSTKNIIEKQVIQLQTGSKQKDGIIEKLRAQLKKSQKLVQNYLDQAGLFKSQLINERSKHEQKMQTLIKSKETYGQENKSLKQKNLQLRKALDLKEIEVLNLRQEAKRFQNKLKDISEKKEDGVYKSQHFMKSRTNQFISPAKLQSPGYHQQQTPNNYFAADKNLKYNNYQDLYIQLKPLNKELFIRLCRCGLKKKDILLKQNQLEIGIISQVLSEQKVKFILHFTNTSQKQIENLKIDYTVPQSYLSTLDYQIDNKYIFCIQPQEQEKVTIIITNKQPPFLKERAILQISYDKNEFFLSSNLFLPFFITRFFEFYRPKPANAISQKTKSRKETLIMKYNRKMIPKTSAIKSFFEEAEQISPNKFEIEALHRQTDTLLRLTLDINTQNQTLQIDLAAVKEKQNDKQRYIFQQLFSFLQSAFKR